MAEQIPCLLIEPGNNDGPPPASDDSIQDFSTGISKATISPSVLSLPGWRPSPISAQLGVPLKALRRSPTTTSPTGFNICAQLLYIDPDTTSSSFAKFSLAPITGPVVVVHCDGVQLLGEVVVVALTKYINAQVGMYSDKVIELAEGDEKERAKQQLALKLSKEAFHAHFVERRRVEIAAGRSLFWRDIKSPVLLKYPQVAAACGGCGTLGSTSVSLSVCGGCRIRYFCSRECQRKDWKTHKRACAVQV
jgi:hypothetical protein